MAQVVLKPIKRVCMAFTIVGTSPLIVHAWSEKAKEMMRQKHGGKKTKNRDVRDPQAEMEEACYRTSDGRLGISGMALKSSIVTAAHRDIGIERTLVRKAMFLRCDDPNKIVPLIADTPTLREDMVRVGIGSADLRYRPMWSEWAVESEWHIDADLLTTEDVLTLVDRAGFGVGIGEWRPEKGGEFGRFEVDHSAGITVEELSR